MEEPNGLGIQAKVVQAEDYTEYGKTRFNIQGAMTKFIYAIQVQ